MKYRGIALVGSAGALALAGVMSGIPGAQAGSEPTHSQIDSVSRLHRLPGRPAGSVEQAQRMMGDRASLNLVTHGVEYLNSLDIDPAGFSPGDVYLFKVRLYDESRSRVVGSDAEHCEVGFDTYSCQVTVRLTGRGKIEAEGAFFEDNVIPVTGGTGEFKAASGELHVFLLQGHHDELYSFQLAD
jgi:hypothetical protein